MELLSIFHTLSSYRTSVRRIDIAVGSGLVIASYLIHRIWGKIAALCFISTVISSYPELTRQLENLVNFDVKVLTQATFAITIAGFCFYNPPIAASMAFGLSIAIVKREMTMAAIAKANAEQIKTLQGHNEKLSAICDRITLEANAWESQLTQCLGISKKVEQAVTHQTAAAGVDQQLTDFRAKMQTITSLCQTAAQNEGFIGRLAAANKVEESLAKMTVEWSAKKQELTILTGRIEALRSQLSRVIQTLKADDLQLRNRLEQISQWLQR